MAPGFMIFPRSWSSIRADATAARPRRVMASTGRPGSTILRAHGANQATTLGERLIFDKRALEQRIDATMASEDSTGAKRSEAYAREHLANERTHLAYVRTAIALLSFGITLNRLSLYILEAEAPAGQAATRSPLRDAMGVGAGMVLLGMALMAWAAVRYVRVCRAIERGEYRPDRTAILIFTATLFLLGAASALWLFWS